MTATVQPVAHGDGPRRHRRDAAGEDVPPGPRAEPSDHLAGQHVVVRLTAPDGYTAQRSYSVASAPDGTNELDLTVERLDDGEVSTFLHDVVEPGDELEIRGPLGGWFVWDGTSPVLLVGGGSGVVPLMAMLRLARRTGRTDLVRLVVSVRSPDDLLYADRAPRPRVHHRLHARRAAGIGAPAGPPDRGRRAGAARRRTRPPTCAARPASATPPVTSSSGSACPSSGSGSSASDPPADPDPGTVRAMPAPPTFECLRVSVDGPIGRLELHRPDRLNALSRQHLGELAAAARWFDTRRDVKVVGVTGAGRSFCAGFDLGDFAAPDPDLPMREVADLGRIMAEAITDMRALTVVGVHGSCVGGGLVLAAACDLRVATATATFSIPEVALGIPLAWAGIPRLVREIGPALTKELVLTCRPFAPPRPPRPGSSTASWPTTSWPPRSTGC